MAKNTKNFKVSEFDCKCGCGFNIVDQRLIDMCQTIRDYLGVPVKINSGCRCEKHNAKVGGVKGSYHTKGLAADLSCSLGAEAIWDAVHELHDAWEFPDLSDLSYCIWYKKKNFVHIDCGAKRKNLYEVRA